MMSRRKMLAISLTLGLFAAPFATPFPFSEKCLPYL